MARIDKLTPEQTARFAEWSQRWIEIGLSTEPADFDAATEAALRAYQFANLKRPMVILRMSSPYGATLGGALARAMLRQLGDREIRSQVGSQVESQVRSQVRSQVWSQVWSQVESQVRDANYNSYHGSLYASWTAYVSFLRDVCGWSDPVLSRFEIDEALVRNCGWVWWHESVLAISDRPTVINRDEAGRLHCETGPSISYRDGWQLHHWHGISVPAEWIEDRTNLSPATVLKSKNVEQRAAGAAIVGWPKMVSKLKRKIIDGDPDSDIGALIELTLPGLREPGRFLQALCPRNGTIVEGVPRTSDIDNLPIDTAIAAQAWRDGVPKSEYQHPLYRT